MPGSCMYLGFAQSLLVVSGHIWALCKVKWVVASPSHTVKATPNVNLRRQVVNNALIASTVGRSQGDMLLKARRWLARQGSCYIFQMAV